VIDNQTGSEFKDFKNLEVLKVLEQKVPEETVQAIRQVKQNVLQKLEVKIDKLQESEKFQNYIENTSGNKTIQSGIIEEMSLSKTSQTTAQEPEKAKEQIEKAKNELQQILENKDFEKYLTDLTLIEVIKKHLSEAETAFSQKNFGQAFGQATAGLHQIASLKNQIASLKNLIKKEELQQNEIQEKNKQIEQKEKKLEWLIRLRFFVKKKAAIWK
jgi:tripartite-type tricarboxylate transporter receptor subunit TctC